MIDDDNRLQRVVADIVGEAMDQQQSQLLLHAPDLQGGERIMTTQLPQAIVGLPVDPQPVPGSNADTGEADVQDTPAAAAINSKDSSDKEGNPGE